MGGIKTLINKLVPTADLVATMRRFPLSVGCALGLFFIAISAIHDLIDVDDELMVRVITLFSCCFFWFGFAKLAQESLTLNTIKHYGLAALGAVAVGSLIWLSDFWPMHMMFVVPSLLLMLMFAPFLKSGEDTSVWWFNHIMWQGVAISYLALLLFAGGLSVALFSIRTLFDVDVPDEIYGDIWSFACLVLGPLYALSWVPKRFDVTESDLGKSPVGLRFIVNWISAPMVFVYLLILYAYFIKIVLTGEVPNGHLAYMISGFAGAGIVTYLVSFPLRESGAWQLRLFHKVFFPALIIPVGFHFYAIWERVSAYGITEQRYMLFLSALWFMILAIGNTMGRMPIKAIPATLAFLFIFGSFGPWGGIGLSGASQSARLEKALIANDLLVDGVLVKAQRETDISFDERKNISSIINYLCDSNRYSALRPWFAVADENNEFRRKSQPKNDVLVCLNRSNMKAELGFEYVGYWRSSETASFDLSAQEKDFVDVVGYDRIIPNRGTYHYANQKKTGNPTKQTLFIEAKNDANLTFDGRVLRMEIPPYPSVEMDVQRYVTEQLALTDDERVFTVTGENEMLSYKFNIKSISGGFDGDAPSPRHMLFDFLYKEKK